MPRYPGLTLRILSGDEPAIGPGKARLVTLIDATGSISAAARELGMSYRRAWLLVEALNASFTEPVVTKATGGKRGGGAAVTPFGKRIVEAYYRMESKASASIEPDIGKFSLHLRKPMRKGRQR
jgi:molybdate transport system regulatory protein